MNEDPRTSYRSAATLAFWTCILFACQAAVEGVAALTTAGFLFLVDCLRGGATLLPAQAEIIDDRRQLIAGIQLVAQIVPVILLVMWVYRANRNARALDAPDMKYTPGWSVGWFFVPIASLVKPYSVLKEIWQASSPLKTGQSWREAAVSPLLTVWWVMWIACCVVQYSPGSILMGYQRLSDFSRLGSTYQASIWEWGFGLMVKSVLEIILSGLTIPVVIWITSLQEQKVKAMDSEPASYEEALA